jgi:hypothetical protein
VEDKKEFEIWIEGYAATGEYSHASYIGKSSGHSFEDACRNFRYPEDIIREYDGMIIVHKGESLKLDENRSHPCIWACRLFDNETDARESFG